MCFISTLARFLNASTTAKRLDTVRLLPGWKISWHDQPSADKNSKSHTLWTRPGQSGAILLTFRHANSNNFCSRYLSLAKCEWNLLKLHKEKKFAVRNVCTGSNYQARLRQASSNESHSLVWRFPLFSFNDKDTSAPRARFSKPTLACTIEKLCKLLLLSSAGTRKKVKTIFSCSSWDTNYEVLQHEHKPAMEIPERTKRNFVRVRKNFLSCSEI